MKSNQLFISVLAMVGSSSVIAAPSAQTYTYNARVPAMGARSCANAAQDLAERLQALVPSVTNAQGTCVARANFTDHGEQFAVDTLKVTYSSTNYPIALTSIQFPSFEYGAYHTYPTYRDCLNDLSEQSATFINATGLQILAGTCMPSTDSSSSFILKIDAAGTPARTLHVMHNLASARLDTNANWKTQILNLISKSGGIVAKTDEDMIAYYAAANVEIGSGHWVRANSQEQCQSQVAEVTSMAQKLGANHVVATCNTEYGHYYLDAAFDASSLPAFTTTYHDTFFTFEECMAVRQSMLDREPLSKQWLGSFCTTSDYGDDRYLLQVVTRF
jgi:hypothetical protein